MRTEVYIIAIQGSHGAEVVSPDCLYTTYAEAEAVLKIRRADGHSDYLKIFTLRQGPSVQDEEGYELARKVRQEAQKKAVPDAA